MNIDWKQVDQEMQMDLVRKDAAEAVRKSREDLARARQDFEDELEVMREDLWAVKQAAEQGPDLRHSRHELALLLVIVLLALSMGFTLGITVAQWLHR